MAECVQTATIDVKFAFGKRCSLNDILHSISSQILARWMFNHTYLKQPEPDQLAAWASRGAGLFTDEILQTVRDPTSLGAQR